MASFTVELDGQRELAGHLLVWERKKHAEIAELLRATAADILRDAEAAAPSRTGRLRREIKADLDRVLSDLVADVVAGVFYARFVENGTAKLGAHPFLFPAFEANAQAYFVGLRRILNP